MNQKEKNRHVRWYRALRAVAGRPIARHMNFHYEPVQNVDTPYILLSNHNTDLDPVLIGLAFPDQMYFVASEHVFRKKFWSRLLVHIFAPISRMKGTADAAAALEIIRSSRKGNNVCLFAEGNRSYTGVTGPVFPATGKLIKASGATLYTYRFEGGYLASPRWGKHHRRGPITGKLVGKYAPEDLRGMTPDEINAHIAQDLHEDAFLRQETEHIRYPGKDIAESLETALYICPACGKIGHMESRGDHFFCKDCGFSVHYTEEGYFSGDDLPYRTVRDWDAFQTKQMQLLATSLSSGEEAFSDEGVTLDLVEQEHQVKHIKTGRLSMTKDALLLDDLLFPLSDISGMGLFGKAKIAMTYARQHYEIRFLPARCGRKYFTLYQMLHG